MVYYFKQIPFVNEIFILQGNLQFLALNFYIRSVIASYSKHTLPIKQNGKNYLYLYCVVFLSPIFSIIPFLTAKLKSRLAVAEEISLKFFK